jgi:Na+-transporting methylmalonyl-CoA/oxaloacetate decarboxylase gamma subunit
MWMVSVLSALASTLPIDPTAAQMTEFLLSGIIVVILVLAFLALCCGAVGVLLRVSSSALAPKKTAGAESHEVDEISEEIAVVITAAVAAVIGESHHIVHMREVRPQELNWTMEGRMYHHASHQPPPRGRGQAK